MTQQEFEMEWRGDGGSVVCHTSGSTGSPKEIRLAKDFMRESARRTNAFFGINGSSRLHTCLDFGYIASKMMTVRADEAQCRLTSEIPSSSPLGEIGKDEVIDLLSVVPAQIGGVLDAVTPWTGIKAILVGGSAVPPLLRKRISLSAYQAWETYGMTETASHIALRRIVEDEREPFKTLPGITVGVTDEGCLTVSLPDCDVIETRDLAEVLSETEFRILGRADNCIISGGVKIIPEDLESLLGPFIAFDYCISSVPDVKWGEKAVLAVAAEDSCLDRDFLKEAVGVRLGQYRSLLNLGVKTPKEVIIIESIPKTSNGKINRPALKEMLSSGSR